MYHREEKINSLLLDNRFVDWVVNPQSPYAEYWLQWISESNDNAVSAEEAKRFLFELRMAESEAGKEVNKGTTEQMWDRIHEAIDQDSIVVQIHTAKPNKYWVAMAAAITGLILFSAIAFFKQSATRFSSIETPKENMAPPEVVHYNGSEKNELIFLPDGSKITLAKGARISYNRLMNGKKRKVYLKGEAFFDVAKNPEKPFYIYTPNMIVKVLGTSFRVITSVNKESVIVKTGKVSVYMLEQDLEQSAPKILLPRQACVYTVANRELSTMSYTGKSKIEMETDTVDGYDFEDASLDIVFKALEKMYAMPVHYDQKIFENCFITISLGSESLEQKLEVITKTVGASFSISDYGINIEGKGCK